MSGASTVKRTATFFGKGEQEQQQQQQQQQGQCDDDDGFVIVDC